MQSLMQSLISIPYTNVTLPVYHWHTPYPVRRSPFRGPGAQSDSESAPLALARPLAAIWGLAPATHSHRQRDAARRTTSSTSCTSFFASGLD